MLDLETCILLEENGFPKWGSCYKYWVQLENREWKLTFHTLLPEDPKFVDLGYLKWYPCPNSDELLIEIFKKYDRGPLIDVQEIDYIEVDWIDDTKEEHVEKTFRSANLDCALAQIYNMEGPKD